MASFAFQTFAGKGQTVHCQEDIDMTNEVANNGWCTFQTFASKGQKVHRQEVIEMTKEIAINGLVYFPGFFR
jgi:hypothetical protein